MSTLTYKKFEDIDSGALPDKMTVYQECLQAFNASPVQAKRCRLLLSRLLRLLYCGESFPTAESTTLFFSISKLFQHNDFSLRQLVYVTIKELSAVSDDVLMVTSSIMKDIQNGEIIYKPNAIRALARVLDGTTIHAAERIMKNSIVDKNQSVSSAALVSSYHLLPVAKDVMKRWTNEIQESIMITKAFSPQQFATHEYYGANKLPSSTYAYQYHALGLLYHLKNHDKMALVKMIQQINSSSQKNSPALVPLAIIQLIRYIGKIIEEDPSVTQTLLPFLESWLRHKSDMVELEAAKTILSLPGLSSEMHLKAINSLQVLLSVPRTVTRFAAVRILNRIAMKNPEKIVVCNVELESLINDSNRSISTYAITTLLKTGNSDNVDRLIKTISGFMDDISDEFKIIVIEAVRTLSLKFPEKHQSMLSFLNDVLRDEGGFNFKNAIIEAIFDIIKFVPESREAALEILCEFIEDCEFTELAVRVLHLLGTEGPKTPNPTLYVRHIYNRVVLENSIVRSSAVIALSKFALLGDESIAKSIKILLTRCLSDVDDEVRDRAALSLKLLSSKDTEEAKVYLAPSVKYSLPVLEQRLAMYVSGDKDTFSTPFDISAIPTFTDEEAKAMEYKEKTAAVSEEPSVSPEDKEDDSANETYKKDLLQQQYAQELSAIPEIAAYGSLLHSSSPVDLTEKETEFVVTAIKHVFEEHLVIQYNVNNTLTNMELDDVTIVSQPDAEDIFAEDFIIPIEVLKPQQEAAIYVSFSRPDGIEPGVFVNTLSYTAKDVDPTTLEPQEGDDGFPDEYQIEDLQVTPGDYITPAFVGNFTHVWDEMSNEQSAVYNLTDVSSLEEFVTTLLKSLSMFPMDLTEQVSSNTHHTLKAYGKTLGGSRVAATIRLASTPKGYMMKAQVKSDDEAVSDVVANNIL